MRFVEGYEEARAALQDANQKRAFSSQPEIEKTVREICEAVRQEGDAALQRYQRQFDCATFDIANVRVTSEEIDDAYASTRSEVKKALKRAAKNIEEFHRRQPVSDWMTTSPDGVFLGQRYTPVPRVALYAPNGRAAYPSTVLMLAIPARVAGVPEIVLASPPSQDGSANQTILAAAKIAGISEIYKLGGAPAMAALAYGTKSVKPVDKLVGPGNLYVTLAKKYLYGTVGIDGLYGPSELVILADFSGRRGVQESSPHPAQLAADIIAQAEHEPNAWVCFIATSRMLCAAVMSEVEAQAVASTRGAILEKSLANALFLYAPTLDEACALADLAAPEHLEIWSREPLALSSRVKHAGAIFLNTPVPLGDYIAGPSHTLPTGATARFAHGVGVETFLKRTSLISAPRAAIAALGDDLDILATLEELPGHAAAVRRAAQ